MKTFTELITKYSQFCKLRDMDIFGFFFGAGAKRNSTTRRQKKELAPSWSSPDYLLDFNLNDNNCVCETTTEELAMRCKEVIIMMGQEGRGKEDRW